MNTSCHGNSETFMVLQIWVTCILKVSPFHWLEVIKENPLRSNHLKAGGFFVMQCNSIHYFNDIDLDYSCYRFVTLSNGQVFLNVLFVNWCLWMRLSFSFSVCLISSARPTLKWSRSAGLCRPPSASREKETLGTSQHQLIKSHNIVSLPVTIDNSLLIIAK